jgi:DNA-binding PadR family transcriptional regulator
MFYEHHHRHHLRRSLAHWMGRHRGGRGFGHFTAGFTGDTGFGGSGFRLGRKFAAADLQLIILALLAVQPRHGYELIKALEEHSGGFYSPSPGVIYPALTYLEEIGHATVEAEGTKKLYRITEEGIRHLAANREAADAMLDGLARIGRKMAHVRQVFTGETPPGDEADDQGGSDELRQARRLLRLALHPCRSPAYRRDPAARRRGNPRHVTPPPYNNESQFHFSLKYRRRRMRLEAGCTGA